MFWKRNDRANQRQDVLDRVVAARDDQRRTLLEQAVAAGEIAADDVDELLRLAARLDAIHVMTPGGWAAQQRDPEPALQLVAAAWDAADWETEDAELIGVEIVAGNDETDMDAGFEPAGRPFDGHAGHERATDFASRIRARRRAALIENNAARIATRASQAH